MKVTAEQFRAEMAGKQGRQGKGKRASKYGSVKTMVGDVEFDSAKEAARYADLILLQRAGVITKLETQVATPLYGFDGEPLRGGSGRPLHYIADFTYIDAAGLPVVEDVKGFKTRVYLLKKAILRCQGVKIVET